MRETDSAGEVLHVDFKEDVAGRLAGVLAGGMEHDLRVRAALDAAGAGQR